MCTGVAQAHFPLFSKSSMYYKRNKNFLYPNRKHLCQHEHAVVFSWEKERLLLNERNSDEVRYQFSTKLPSVTKRKRKENNGHILLERNYCNLQPFLGNIDNEKNPKGIVRRDLTSHSIVCATVLVVIGGSTNNVPFFYTWNVYVSDWYIVHVY